MVTVKAAIVALLLAIWIANRIRTYLRLSHIPGPWLAGFSRIWMVRGTLSGRNHEYLYEASLKYGDLVRIGPNHLMTSDAEVVRRMDAPRSAYRRSPWFTTFRFKPRADSIISTVDEKQHMSLRRKMAAGYSGKEVPELESQVDKHVKAWIDLIESKYISSSTESKPMDFGRATQYFTLDVISDIAFRFPFGDLRDDADNFDYIKTSEDVIVLMCLLAIYPNVHRWIEQSRLIDLLAPKAKDKTGLGRVVGIAQNVVHERFHSDKHADKQDMLASFIKHGLSQDEAESETVLQVIAGSDTTATAIRVGFLYIMTNPLVYTKLRAEIDTAILEKRVSSPIQDIEARKLPYLQACIQEALRLWIPTPGIFQMVVPPEGDTINGKFVPGGTFIGQCKWAFGREPKVFGSDFAVFRPERWLEASPEKLQAMDRQVELTFSYGRFKCLGQPVAWMELNKVFVELLKRYDLTIANPSKPWDSYGSAIFLQKDFWVRITPRTNSKH